MIVLLHCALVWFHQVSECDIATNKRTTLLLHISLFLPSVWSFPMLDHGDVMSGETLGWVFPPPHFSTAPAPFVW